MCLVDIGRHVSGLAWRGAAQRYNSSLSAPSSSKSSSSVGTARSLTLQKPHERAHPVFMKASFDVPAHARHGKKENAHSQPGELGPT